MRILRLYKLSEENDPCLHFLSIAPAPAVLWTHATACGGARVITKQASAFILFFLVQYPSLLRLLCFDFVKTLQGNQGLLLLLLSGAKQPVAGGM